MDLRQFFGRNHKLDTNNEMIKKVFMGEDNNIFEEENGEIIYEFLSQDEEQIKSSFYDNPKKALQKIVITVLRQSQQIFVNLMKELQEQKHYLTDKLKNEGQYVQQLLLDNEHFKDRIQELYQEKKEMQIKFSQLEDENQRFRQQHNERAAENQRLKQQHSHIINLLNKQRTQNEQIRKQNMQSEQAVYNLQSSLTNIETSYEQLMYQHEILQNKEHDLQLQLNELRQQSEMLAQRLNIKQEFIASFADQYNKCLYFKPQDQPSSCAKYKNMEDQFQGRYPEIYIKNLELFLSEHRNFSKEASAFKNLASKQQHITIDNFQSQKRQIKILPFHAETKSKISSISRKRYLPQQTRERMEAKKASYYEEISPINKRNKERVKNSKTSENGLSSSQKKKFTIIKTINEGNSKRFANFKKQINPFCLEDYDKTPEHILSKKLTEKDEKILALQKQLALLRNQYMEQRQIVTLLEGEYELKMEDIQDQLSDTKNCLSDIYSKYALKKAQCESYQQALDQIKGQIGILKEQYRKKLSLLKSRLKTLFISHFNDLEEGYLTIIEISSQLTSQCENRLNHSLQGQGNLQNIPQQILQMQSSKTLNLNQQSICLSDIKCQQIVSNKQIRGISFNLDFSSETINKPQKQQSQQIYVCQNYVISSNLGAMTERANIHSKENDKICFTERKIQEEELMECNQTQTQKSRNNLKTKLTVNSKVYEQSIINYKKHFDLFPVIDIVLSKAGFLNLEDNANVRSNSFQITNQFCMKWERTLSQPVKFYLQSKIFELSISHKKQQRLVTSQMLYIKMPHSKIATYKISSNIFFATIDPISNKLSSSMNQLSFISIPAVELIDCMCETDAYYIKYTNQQKFVLSHLYSLVVQKEHMEANNDNEQIERQQTIKQNSCQSYIMSCQIQNQVIQSDSIRNTKEKYPSQNEVKNQIQSISKLSKQSNQSHININQNGKPDYSNLVYMTDQHFQNITYIEANANDRQLSNSEAQTIKDHNYLLQQFLDFNKQLTMSNQAAISERIPRQVTQHLQINELTNLNSFLNKYDYSLELQQVIKRPHIKKPSGIKEVVIIFNIKDSSQDKCFLLSQYQLSSLTTKQYIQFNHQKVIDKTNFMFGQSEVIISGDGYLIVRREGKRNKLKGTLPDNEWKIDSYFVCRCKAWDKFYCE